MFRLYCQRQGRYRAAPGHQPVPALVAAQLCLRQQAAGTLVDQGGSSPPFCDRPVISFRDLIRPTSAEQIEPVLPLLAKLFGWQLTFDQLIEAAPSHASEVGYDLSSTSATLIHRGFSYALQKNGSIYANEHGIVTELRVADKHAPAAKTSKRQVKVEQLLIEDKDDWEKCVLEVIRSVGPIFAGDAQEIIRDERGSDSYLVPADMEEGVIESEVDNAIDRLHDKGQIENDPDEGGWIVSEC